MILLIEMSLSTDVPMSLFLLDKKRRTRPTLLKIKCKRFCPILIHNISSEGSQRFNLDQRRHFRRDRARDLVVRDVPINKTDLLKV